MCRLPQATAMTLPVIAVLAALLVAVAAATVHAHEPVGTDFRISNVGADGDIARNGGVPATAYNSAANEYLVVWQADALSTDNEFEVFGQRMSATGAEVGSDFRISNTGTDGDAARTAGIPAVAYSTAANEYLVAWQGDGLATNDEVEIFGQRVSASGAELGGDFRISNTGSDGDATDGAFSTAVAFNSAANEYLVSWSSDPLATDNEFEIFGQRVSAAGAEIGADFRISNVGSDGDGGRDATVPAVDYSTAANEYLVTWHGDGLATDDELEIFGQRVDTAGTEVGGDFRISTAGADGDSARDAAATSPSYNPAANEYLVTWQADGLATDEENETFGQRLSATGVEVGADFRISSVGNDGDASRDSIFPATVRNTVANQYLVVWHADDLATDDEVEIFGRRLAIVPPATAPAVESPRTVTCFGERPTILGTPAAEPIRGTKGRDVIVAGAGDDIVLGLGGDDLICAGEGSDDLRGDAGKDTILGRNGSDDLRGGGGDDRLQGGEGSDDLFGGSGSDALVGAGSRDDSLDRRSHDACRGGGGEDRVFACQTG